jgi:hypothetical protein
MMSVETDFVLTPSFKEQAVEGEHETSKSNI